MSGYSAAQGLPRRCTRYLPERAAVNSPNIVFIINTSKKSFLTLMRNSEYFEIKEYDWMTKSRPPSLPGLCEQPLSLR